MPSVVPDQGWWMMRLRFLMVLTVTSVLLASFAPTAFAQAVAGDAGDDKRDIVQYVDCSQVQQAVQGQYGAANAVADDGSTATAANELGITQNQVNACLGNVNKPEEKPAEEPTGNKDPKEDDGKALREGEDEVKSDTIPEGTLPETGGPGLFAPAAGVVLVAGGAVLLRAGRR